MEHLWGDAPVYEYEEVDSTNRVSLEIQGPEGTVVTTLRQTAGRGRRGRTWVSPEGGLYFSLTLIPELDPGKVSMLTPVMALSIARCIPEAGIKWPNDLVLDGKKLAGILTEFQQGDPYRIVIGVGINLEQKGFLSEQAITLEEYTGRKWDREELLRACLNAFAVDYRLVKEAGDLSLVKEAYESRLLNLGREVQVLDPKGAYTGIAEGIDLYGRLLVNGRAVDSGEVSVRGVYGYV